MKTSVLSSKYQVLDTSQTTEEQLNAMRARLGLSPVANESKEVVLSLKLRHKIAKLKILNHLSLIRK